MSCSRYEREIALYVEGDLAERQARKLRGHLESCAECRGFLAEMQASQAAIRGIVEEPVNPVLFDGIRAGVLERIQAEQQPGIGSWFGVWLETLRPANLWPWAAAMVVGVFILMALVRPGVLTRTRTLDRETGRAHTAAVSRSATPSAVPGPVPEYAASIRENVGGVVAARRTRPVRSRPQPAGRVQHVQNKTRPAPIRFVGAEVLAETGAGQDQHTSVPDDEGAQAPADGTRPAAQPSLLAKFETDDPNVVIYWVVN